MKPQPTYSLARDTWHPHQCPYADDCSKCDVDGHCEKGRGSIPAALCCMCGTVSPLSEWTYWHRNLADDYPPEEEWVPAREGEEDPMMLCPKCKWPHVDNDDGSGVYEGTTAEMNAQREADLPEYGEWWADRLEEVERAAA